MQHTNLQQYSKTWAYTNQVKQNSDRIINAFLCGYFLLGIGLAFFYDTMEVAIGIGGLSLLAYYSTKMLLPKSELYQYVLSVVLGIFMAQYIYQMHGMFEMHFVAFIGSALLVTYQNWKLQIPITLVVAVHHAVFGYLQFLGYEEIYFTQLEYMDLQTFIIHVFLASVIFGICGLWSYRIKKYSEAHIEQSFEIGRLQIAEKQKDELKKANSELDRFVYSVSHDLRAPLNQFTVLQISLNRKRKMSSPGKTCRPSKQVLTGSIRLSLICSIIPVIQEWKLNAMKLTLR